MNPRLTLVALPLLTVAAFAATSGCAPNASVQVNAICYPTDDCTFKSKCDMQFIGYPTATGSIGLFLQVGDQLANNADKGTWRVNTNDAHVDETEVEFDGGPATQRIGSNFNVPAGGTSVVFVKLDLTGATGASVVVAHLRMRGYFDDGTRFETAEFPIAITIGTAALPAGCVSGVTPTCPRNSEGQAPLACGT